MTADDDKRRSRGFSRDMSPEAVARRLDIVSELRHLSLFLGAAKQIPRSHSEESLLAETPKPERPKPFLPKNE